jgi:hypothetical protein
MNTNIHKTDKEISIMKQKMTNLVTERIVNSNQKLKFIIIIDKYHRQEVA